MPRANRWPSTRGRCCPIGPGIMPASRGSPSPRFCRDEWTGETPTAAYWRPVTIVEDTRLAAMATDTTRYSFDLPAGTAAQVKVQLVFRRAFQELAKQKGWTDPDILMEEINDPGGKVSGSMNYG